ncbi:MAG: thiamine pyrophosphate-dependent enzyme, partial [Phycisphaerales bacterium]|nr:thiamine pyrophosphate-dependent enzyme [Phycisphaerales bacterium]
GTKDIAGRAAWFGMPATTVDGTDFFAVYDAMREAVDRAKAGNGPSAIVTEAMRYFGHFVGDPEIYRAKDEVSKLRAEKDPLVIFRNRVTEAGLLEASQLDALDQEVLAEVEKAVEAATAAPFPSVDQLETDVYVAYP